MDARRMLIGAERAKIKPQNIKGKDYQNHVNHTASVMQSAFDFYYYAHQAIERISLPSTTNRAAYSRMVDYKYNLQKNLRDACDKSWSNYDLFWVFKHLAENNGVWYDNSSEGWQGKCNVPVGVANFLNENNERCNIISSKYYEWLRAKDNALRLQRDKKWDELPGQLEKTQKVIDHVLPYIWVVVSKNPTSLNPYTELMNKWIGYGGKVHSILDTTIKVSRDPSRWQRSALEEMSKFVLNQVPVFGSLYAGVINDLPQLMKWFEDYGTKMRHIIDNANNPYH